MKKLLLFMLLCLTTFSAFAQKARVRATVPTLVETKVNGGTFQVEVEIAEADFVVRSFSMKIDTPADIYCKSYTVSDRVTNYTKKSAVIESTPSNTFSLLLNSKSGSPFTVADNKGKVVTLTFCTKAGTTPASGKSYIKIKEIGMTDAANVTHVKVPDLTYAVNFVTKLGDVDLNSYVNRNDVTALSDIILNKNSARPFSPEGNIQSTDNVNSIVDLVRLVGMIKK